MIQKYERKDKLPQLPFHCEEIDEGLPTLTECVYWFFTVALLTIVVCEVFA